MAGEFIYNISVNTLPPQLLRMIVIGKENSTFNRMTPPLPLLQLPPQNPFLPRPLLLILSPNLSDPLVMIEDCYGNDFLGFILSDDEFIEMFFEECGCQAWCCAVLGGLGERTASGFVGVVGGGEGCSLGLEVGTGV